MTSESTSPVRRGLVLIGYRGTGKSTVGRILADCLRLPFVDADVSLEMRFEIPISEVFRESGEPIFRDLEEETLTQITCGPPSVLATGGGAVLRESNRLRLKEFGWIVWLSASSEMIQARLSSNPNALANRPALTAGGTLAEVAEVLAVRRPIYQELADVEVSTDGRTPAEVALAILSLSPPRFSPG